MTASTKQDLPSRFAAVEERVISACGRAGRKRASVQVIAAVKGQPVEACQGYCDWCAERGLTAVLGESYLQELIKHDDSISKQVTRHFIGRLQRNKVRSLVERGLVIQSVDRIELVDELIRCARRTARVVDCFLQVNISGDPAKAGFRPEDLRPVFEQVINEPLLRLNGLMAITALYPNVEDVRPDFRAMRELRDSLNPALDLSIGMSQDLEIAIEEGATLVRVGTALFGCR